VTRQATVTPDMTDTEIKATLFGPKKKAPKFTKARIEIDGYLFDSNREAERYGRLKAMRRAGEIDHLTPHESFDLVVNGYKVGRYTADFTYVSNVGPNKDRLTVEDVKSSGTVKTEAFRLRAQLFYAVTGLQITCVDAKGNILAILPKLPKPKTRKPRKGETTP